MSDIFQEVDEDIKRDKAKLLWRRYGVYLIIACIAIVIGTAARVGWREYKLTRQADESSQYVAATKLLENGDTVGALTSFQSLAAEAGTGYRLLARFRSATALIKAGNEQAGLAIYDNLGKDNDLEPYFQSLAKLQAIMLLIENGSKSDIEARLAPLLADSSPWRYSALELEGILKLREGDTTRARASFKALSEDASAPQGIRNRAAQMLAVLGS